MATEGLESDLVFDIDDACIEWWPEKINNFLDSGGEAGGEDISVWIIQTHGAVEIIWWSLETFKFWAGLIEKTL